MTPGPEGPRPQEGESLEATADRIMDTANGSAAWTDRRDHILLELRVLRMRTHRACRVRLADRLDEALAAPDPEAGIGALARELRGETT